MSGPSSMSNSNPLKRAATSPNTGTDTSKRPRAGSNSALPPPPPLIGVLDIPRIPVGASSQPAHLRVPSALPNPHADSIVVKNYMFGKEAPPQLAGTASQFSTQSRSVSAPVPPASASQHVHTPGASQPPASQADGTGKPPRRKPGPKPPMLASTRQRNLDEITQLRSQLVKAQEESAGLRREVERLQAAQPQLEAGPGDDAMDVDPPSDVLNAFESTSMITPPSPESELETTSEVARLKAENVRLAQERDAAIATGDVVRGQLDTLEATNTELQAQLMITGGTGAPTTHLLNTADDQLVSDLLAGLGPIEDELAHLKAAHGVLETQYAATKAELSQIDTLLRDLDLPEGIELTDNEVGNVRKVLTVLSGAMADKTRLEQEAAMLRGEAEASRAQAVALQTQLESNRFTTDESEVRRLHAALEEQKASAAEMTHDLLTGHDALTEEVAMLRVMADEKEKDMQTARQALADGERETGELKRMVQAQEAAFEAKQQELEAQQEARTGLQQQNTELMNKIQAQDRAAQVLQSVMEDMRKNVTEREAEHTRLTADSSIINALSADLAARLQQTESALQAKEDEKLRLADDANKVIADLQQEKTTLQGELHQRTVELNEMRQRLVDLEAPTSSVRSSRFRIMDAEFETRHLILLVQHENQGGGRQLTDKSWGRILDQLQRAAQHGPALASVAEVSATERDRIIMALKNYYLRWLVQDEMGSGLAEANVDPKTPVRLVPIQPWADTSSPLKLQPVKKPKPVLDPRPIPSPPRLSRAQLDEILWCTSVRGDKLFCLECKLNGYLFDLPLSASINQLTAHSEGYHRQSCDVVVDRTAGMDAAQIRAWFLESKQALAAGGV
ncbi:hypothetical protein MIND_01274700 [Mycena indigotica]|uniref:Uncharacterized protein n=1 Tax=Mycena indigotica TaxID=2126181 RepID=A0A8H6S2L9_9AGAR|nr:uncharacterized protein MIND_01274700 [Mycena indigotica]KAF7291307.1 hypothetical protein MIND_01274700 [Mycena indigotica]